MLNQILSNTPVFVWAILAFLIVRGVIALRTRDVSMNKLFIVPIVMLLLGLFDIVGKFGITGLALASWLLPAAAMLALMRQYAGVSVSPTAAPGRVIVRGSPWPLALMMAIFFTKYVTSITVAIHPLLRHDTWFTVAVCALFGIFNGYLLGRLARDLRAYQGFAAPSKAMVNPA